MKALQSAASEALTLLAAAAFGVLCLLTRVAVLLGWAEDRDV